MKLIAQVTTRHRADCRRRIERIACTHLSSGGYKLAGEFFGNGTFENESFGSKANLPSILEASLDADIHRFVDIGIGEDDERVGAAKLEQTLLHRLPRG